MSNYCYSKTGLIHTVDAGITLSKFKILIDEFSLNMFVYPLKNKTWGKLDAIWTYMMLHYTNSFCIINFLCVQKNRLWCSSTLHHDHLKYHASSVRKIENSLFLVVELIIQSCFLTLTNTTDCFYCYHFVCVLHTSLQAKFWVVLNCRALASAIVSIA